MKDSIAVYLALGSNTGDRLWHILRAVEELQLDEKIKVITFSSIIETAPVGGPPQPDFLNAVCKIETIYKPKQLLAKVQAVEKKLGRVRTIKWGERTIDIDIIFYGNKIVNAKTLTIPHPLAMERLFVLQPLLELEPDCVDPVSGRKVADIYLEVFERTKCRQKKQREDTNISRKKLVVLKTDTAMRRYSAKVFTAGKTVGFIPTMGALHQGHKSLIDKSVRENDITVVSIYVNPKQFAQGEDLAVYPHTFHKDVRLLEEAGCDALFYPSSKVMYPDGFDSYVVQNEISQRLCGAFRAGHFTGVLTVCAKLFNVVQPDTAYFGQKDYQQAVMITKMVKELNMPLKIKVMPTVREKDGLAMSSRNVYLTPSERERALSLFRSLQMADKLIANGERSVSKVLKEMKKIIALAKQDKIDYIDVVDSITLEESKSIKKGDAIVLAVRFGRVRLIDNMIVGKKLKG